MSDRSASPLRRVVRFGATGLLSLAVWTLWLGLTLLLAAQIYIASTDVLEIPAFVQRALEERLAVSGVHATFGRTHFDPSGQVVVENVQMTLPGFAEPLVSARAIMGRINLWALLSNRFEPIEVRVTGLSLRVPAMLSLSGAADEIIRDGDAAFVPRGDELEIEYLTAHLGGMPIAVQGTARVGTMPWNRVGPEPLPLAELLARLYPQVSRQCDAILAQLAAFDRPILQIEVDPADGAAGIAKLNFVAQGFTLSAPTAAQFSQLRGTGELAVGGTAPAPTTLELSAAEAVLPDGARAQNVTAWLKGDFDWSGLAARSAPFRPQSVELVADRISADSLRWDDAIARLDLAAFPQIGAELRGRLWDEPVAIGADLDWRGQTARVRFAGAAPPPMLDFVGRRVHSDLKKFIAYTVPIRAEGEAQFGPNWAFQRASARIALTGLTARQVKIDNAWGTVEFDGRTIRTPEAYARIGDDFARGSFSEDVSTHDYRFLLTGRLRPLDITPWIAGGWWPDFFGNFAFPAEPIGANADLRGCFTDPRKFSAFLDVAVAQPVFRGVAFDHVHARIFARPQYTEGLEFQLTRGGGTATGTFVRRFNLAASALASFDLAAESTLEIAPLGPLLGDGSLLQPFAFAQAPRLALNGHFEGKGAIAAPHQAVHLEVQSSGPFRYYDFPFDRIAFAADVRDDAVAIDRLDADVAGGALTGKAQVSGSGAARRLSFEASLAHASLGKAIAVIEGYSALRASRKPAPPEKFVQEKNSVRIDASIAAAGSFSDPLSFKGTGNTRLQGEELGQIHMLGLLSELLPFTALRFTAARANFRVDGPRLIFSDVTVTGANSALAASGTYALDRSQLDFKVRVNPFQEGKSLPRKFMDAVLTPLSTALEVRLTGSIDKPKWVFTNGPTNFLRNLGPVQPAPPAPALFPAVHPGPPAKNQASP